jgi:two-component system sensor histidine kinase VanS
MLTRLEAHVAEQQRFAANASHELRTPLAITQTLLDVARKDVNRGNDVLVERLHVVNTRAIDVTEALLLLSRADQRSFTREPVDLSLIAEEAAETLLPLAEKRGVEIETAVDATPTIGSHALLQQLATNLVHNAIVHNLPDHGTVWVRTTVQPQSVVLTVENTGEKLDPQLVATLIEPFRRGSERIRTEDAGVGLGLAIVKSITQAHDGSLTLTPRAAGGLCVTVQLPAASARPGR